jgi:hypothetical protein
VAERWQLFGLASAAGLAAWLAWELAREPVPPVADDAAPVALEVTGVPDLEFDEPDLLDFHATLERPLFNDDRQPDEAPADAPEQAGQAPEALPPVRLTAIITEADGRSALLQQAGDPQPSRLREGERLGGWTVLDIQEDKVVLGSAERRSEIPLRVFEPAPPPRPVRPARRPRAAGAPETRRSLARVPRPADEEPEDRADRPEDNRDGEPNRRRDDE